MTERAPDGYAEFPVARDLAATVACTWTRPASASVDVLVLPDGCVDVVWRTDGRLFVAGPDLGPVLEQQPAGVAHDGVRLRTGVAAAVLGVGAHEIRDRRVDMADLWRGAGELVDRLASVPNDRPDLRRSLLLAEVERRLGAASLDTRVLAAVRALSAPASHARVDATAAPAAAIADAVGLSARQLHRRMVHHVGYGPKSLDRVLRFRRFLGLGAAVGRGGRTLAWAAASAGYADQAHLARECRRLAGITPSALVSRTRTDGDDDRSVQDARRHRVAS